jgi:hypothetical protein
VTFLSHFSPWAEEELLSVRFCRTGCRLVEVREERGRGGEEEEEGSTDRE